MHDGPLNVLFICTGNSARSIMAEAVISRVAPRQLDAIGTGAGEKDHAA